MLKKVLLGLAAVVVVFLAVVATQSPLMLVERTATLHAPVDVVFEQVNDFHHWAAWSPWEKMDPAMTKTYSGPESGTGASMLWDSKKDDVGTGRMTITASKPSERIDIKLEFLAPWQATNATVIAFAPSSETDTKVTWTMTGEKNFVMKMVCMFMDADAMVGKDFDKGLAALGEVSVAAAKEKSAKASPVVPVEVAPAPAP